ncbi:MAG TPA: tetratricopeptide repeat protein, partial [Candidatus Eisenbacteria bacterium]|nr:tetratricopeptide repeat protein [Candidatus Eisenbacteria bacterium]
TEGDVNRFGYEFLGHGKAADAVEVFRWNTEDYPESWNTWDSLGEALMRKGEREQAIAAYKKSLELNPRNDNGRAALRDLGDG